MKKFEEPKIAVISLRTEKTMNALASSGEGGPSPSAIINIDTKSVVGYNYWKPWQ